MFDQEYEPRPGTVNLGEEYENLIPALFALRGASRADIIDMWLATNANGMGAFDDVTFYLEFQNGEKATYVIQLKHKKEPITAARFDKRSDDYNIRKYQDSFEEIMNNYETGILKTVPKENILFIIYTIADFSHTIDKRKMQELNLKLEPGKDEESELINTSMNSDFIYKLKIDNESEFCSYNKFFLPRFRLLIKQARTHYVEYLIQKLISEQFGNCNRDITISFLNFIKMWARGNLGKHYKLRKSDIQLKLSELLLFPYVKEPKRFCQFKKAHIWNEFISFGKLVVTENYTEGMLVKIWSAVNSILYEFTDQKFRENVSWTKPIGINLESLPRRYKNAFRHSTMREIGKTMEITTKCLYTVLWKEGLVPLVLIADDAREVATILVALSLTNHDRNNINAILLIKGKNEKIIDSAIQTLADITNVSLKNTLLDNLYVSLQSRAAFPLSKIVPSEHGILKEITIELILEMLNQPLTIGNRPDNLPPNYINRTVSKIILDSGVLKMDQHAFVINGPIDYINRLTNNERLIDGNNYFKSLKETQAERNVIALEEGKKLTKEELQHFSNNKSGIHYLKCQKGLLEWSHSQGHIKDLKKYLINVPECYLNEEHILTHSSRKVNILTAEPGMGKTVMMKRLAENYLNNHWVVTIFLNCHYAYFKKFQSPNLQYFSHVDIKSGSNFGHALVSLLKESGNVVYLLDAFDEISSECAEAVISLAKFIENQGYPMWITTRPALSEFLEKRLNVFSVHLNPIQPLQQKAFLKSQLPKTNIDHLMERLGNLMSKSFYGWDKNFLGVPLHLQMLGEVLEYGRNADEIQNMSALDLYEKFISRKLDVYWKKMFGDNKSPLARSMYEREIKLLQLQHSKAALFLFYSKNCLANAFDCAEIETFLENTKNGKENIGIILTVANLEKPTFVHRTFAEYLAAKYLASHFKDANVKGLLLKLFDVELRMVRQIFDRLLAKDNPLHLAVLNKNLDEVNRLLMHHPDVDQGGRTALHLSASWGRRHNFTETPTFIRWTISLTDHWVEPFEPITIEILKCLIVKSNFSTNEVDQVFGWRAIDYAIHNHCLDVIEILFDQTQPLHYFNKNSLIYYCVKYGYKKILESLTLENYIRLFDTGENLFQIAIKNTRDSIDILNILFKNYSQNCIRTYLSKSDHMGANPLLNASMSGNLKVFHLLLQFGIGLNKKHSNGFAAIHFLTFHNHLNCLKELLGSKAVDVNARANAYDSRDWSFGNPGHTALYFAVNNQNLEIITMLLEKGADLRLTYEQNRTVLHVASINGFVDGINELLDRGAEINYADAFGRTPLHYAAQNSKINCINYLLLRGADGNHPDKLGRTFLHYSVQNVKLNEIKFTEGLPLDFNKRDKDGKTCLFYACQKIKVVPIKYLVQVKLVENNWHHYATTFSNRANAEEKLQNIAYLHKHDADLNIFDDAGLFPLHYAVQEGNLNVIECLLNLGADLNVKDRERGQTGLLRATQMGNVDTMKFLLSFSPDINAFDNVKATCLHVSAEKGFNKCARILIDHGANVNSSTLNGYTPLFIAVRNKNPKLVQLLLKNNANPNISCNDNAMSPLHLAIQKGYVNIANILLKAKVKINQRDSNGWTALHHAAYEGRLECVEPLLKNGAGLHLQDKDGLTPIHLATIRNRPNCLALLVRTRCVKAINIMDLNNSSALHLACSRGYLDCAKILMNKGADLTSTSLVGGEQSHFGDAEKFLLGYES